MNKVKQKIIRYHKELLSDRVTPVGLYLSIRDSFVNTLLLESSDYHSQENSVSYICCEPLASFKAKGKEVTISKMDGDVATQELDAKAIVSTFEDFQRSFEVDGTHSNSQLAPSGLFGFLGFEAVIYFEDIELTNPEITDSPDMYFALYKYVIAFDHFRDRMYLFVHCQDNEEPSFEPLLAHVRGKKSPSHSFTKKGIEETELTDEQMLDLLKKGKEHCHLGDVFQIVLSRRFHQKFNGDEFNVYRALRSINPSPYLFFFDYGDYKVFGSSPESQIVISKRQALINPIAGTFRRTGNDEADAELARALSADEKENAEHVMLVDLARNDLSRHGTRVKVETYKEVQFFSHVIHLVSRVTAQLNEDVRPLQMVADTFPAGTLSGAPKYRALQLINEYEPHKRGFYGGAIGFIGFDGHVNLAITIRSFLSYNNELHYQAGAGVVDASEEASELQEIHNKLDALRSAMKMAEQIN